jgi:hypothetical protein
MGNGLSGRNHLVVLCFVAIIVATINVIGQAITSAGRMWFEFLLKAVWTIVLTSASFVLIARLGALANLIACGLHLLTVSIYLADRLRARYSFTRCPNCPYGVTGLESKRA